MQSPALDVLIVGAGFSGLCAAIQLKRAGRHRFVVLEQASEVGGTWQANVYPGAACDVQSHVYSYSFEPWPYWTHMFAPQPEIFAYLRHCAAKYELYPHIRFKTRVVSAAFDAASGCWTVTSADGQQWTARAVISAIGGLSRPMWPQISGIETFRGASFHTARWDYSVDLGGKRVGIMGTGASAIQVVPSIAPKVGHLTVFQRTPPWLLARPDRFISAAERRLYALFPALQALQRLRLYWSLEYHALAFMQFQPLLRLARKWALDFLEASVKDPALRALLTPDYSIGCKRILISNDYYEAIQRPNVSLVPRAVAEVMPDGVRDVDGHSHPLDVLVFATGFEAAEAVSPFSVTGLDGADLNAQWTTHGAEAYRGTTVSGFPNFFFLMGPNTALGHNSVILMIEAQVHYIMAILPSILDARPGAYVHPRPEAQRAYNEDLQRRLSRTVWASGCKSWYRTRSGKNTTLWPGFTWAFMWQNRQFDSDNYLLSDPARQAH